MSRRFARLGGPTGSEQYQGAANLVASATPHTMGPWSTIDASVAQDCCGLWIGSNAAIGGSGVDSSTILELGFGAAAAEVTQVQVAVGYHLDNIAQYLPLHLPAGVRLAGRVQSAVVSKIYTPQVMLEYAVGRFAWGGYTVAEAIGLDMATSAPTTGDLADNAWDEAVASAANPYRALTMHLCGSGVAMTNANIRVDAGVGAAGSEAVLGTWFCKTSSAEQVFALFSPRFVEVPTPAGARLALRKNNTADLSGHLIGWR